MSGRLRRGYAAVRCVVACVATFACHDSVPEPASRSVATPSSVAPAPSTLAVTTPGAVPVAASSVPTPSTSAVNGAPPNPTPGAASGVAASSDGSFRFPAPAELVAIGDIHGDLAAARRALKLAGAIDDADRWIGKKLVVVQTGDEIDRGDDDRAVLELFRRLADDAAKAGGAVHALNGNHEAMNVAGDFRYVTAAGFRQFVDQKPNAGEHVDFDSLAPEQRGRAAAFSPGGSTALLLSERDTVVVVGDSVFVHGGVTAEHVRYGLGRFNREVKRWMHGDDPPPALVTDPEGPVWTRRYSDDHATVDCDGLRAALALLHAKRMVVGHTPQPKGIDSACDELVYRVDTGLSRYYGGPTEVLVIAGDRVTIRREPPASPP